MKKDASSHGNASKISPEAPQLADELFVKPIAKIVEDTGLPKLGPVIFEVLKGNYELLFLVKDSKDLVETLQVLEETAGQVEADFSAFENERKKVAESENAKIDSEYQEKRQGLVKSIAKFAALESLPHDDAGETVKRLDRDLERLMKRSRDTSVEALETMDAIHDGFVTMNYLLAEADVFYLRKLIRQYRWGYQWRNAIWWLTDMAINAGAVGILISGYFSGVIISIWTGALAVIILFLWNVIKYKRLNPWIKEKMQKWRRSILSTVAQGIGKARVSLAVSKAQVDARPKKLSGFQGKK